MFTGLIEDQGRVVRVEPLGGGRQLTILTELDDLAIGDSIACNGVCLTVEALEGDSFTVTAGPETLSLTTFSSVFEGATLHLERSLRVGDRLGGHWVQGHVDAVGVVDASDGAVLWIAVPPELAKYVAAKGSVCLDGVSLTVNEVVGARFRVNLIPHTTEVTHLGVLRPGDGVNVEVDVLAKYVERLLQAHNPAGRPQPG